ncbi:MerR family DNA-binding transcriptional regulator [Streptomyces sp. AC627_RSS907]|uniref:MerR family DNA-binding transcriptional regulator n=1 Tax=Streptomyces sp. AC627_RSS907 TaxID=2823684 RepID=UPI0035B3A5F5
MRIGGPAARAGTTTRTLRPYESRGLLPARRAGNGLSDRDLTGTTTRTLRSYESRGLLPARRAGNGLSDRDLTGPDTQRNPPSNCARGISLRIFVDS